MAVLFLLVVTAAPAFASAPSITSFAPASGPAGCVVTITGTNFTSPLVSGVDFNGTSAAIGLVTPTQILATVPVGATSGPIHVVNADGTATSSNFSVASPGGCAPTIASFSPTSGVVGTPVTITGTNLLGATTVSFNNIPVVSFSTNTAGTQITTTVPATASTGRIRVTTAVATATSATDFSVSTGAPTIASFSPTSGPVGTQVTIAGTNFLGTTSVTFDFVAASFSVGSATQITATVPGAATSGRIRVTTPAGTGTSGSAFTVTTAKPTITSFSPTSGPAGTAVTIAGTNFLGTTSVTFNNVAASFSVGGATRITATVPGAATTGRIKVTTPAGTATSATTFTVTTGKPTITSFSPTSGPVGSAVTIFGTNLLGTTSVTFNNVAASFSVGGATQITATVPSGATTGRIKITTPGGTATSATNFTVTGTSAIHERSVTLTLKSGSLKATGAVTVSDGFSACGRYVPVQIQKQTSSGWKTLTLLSTNKNGSFSGYIPNRPGKYRAKAIKVTLQGGNVCGADVSAVRRN